MNIIFWLFVLIILVVLWLGLSYIFKPIGNFICGIFNHLKNTISGSTEADLEEEKEGKKE